MSGANIVHYSIRVHEKCKDTVNGSATLCVLIQSRTSQYTVLGQWGRALTKLFCLNLSNGGQEGLATGTWIILEI